MTEKEYNEIPAVRRTALWEMRKSPLHYKYMVEHEEPPTEAMVFGAAVHKYILEPQDFLEEYIISPKIDRRTKAGKEAYTALLESGRTVLSEETMQVIKDMKEAVFSHATARELLTYGEHEKPIQWTEVTQGVPCKCRVDCLTTYQGKPLIVDYKTTTTCESGAFERACKLYGYKLQAAMYRDGVFAETLRDCGFAFVPQEKKPPYAVRVYFCDPGFLEEGAALFHRLLRQYKTCAETGVWPGYPDAYVLGDE